MTNSYDEQITYGQASNFAEFFDKVALTDLLRHDSSGAEITATAVMVPTCCTNGATLSRIIGVHWAHDNLIGADLDAESKDHPESSTLLHWPLPGEGLYHYEPHHAMPLCPEQRDHSGGVWFIVKDGQVADAPSRTFADWLRSGTHSIPA